MPPTPTDAALEAMLFARVGIAAATRRGAEPDPPFIVSCADAASH